VISAQQFIGGPSGDLENQILAGKASNRKMILTCIIGERPLIKLWEKVLQFDQLAI
jgi:hypothetical protein